MSVESASPNSALLTDGFSALRTIRRGKTRTLALQVTAHVALRKAVRAIFFAIGFAQAGAALGFIRGPAVSAFHEHVLHMAIRMGRC